MSEVKRYTIDADGQHVASNGRVLLEPAVAASDYDALKARSEEFRKLLVECLGDYSHPHFTDRHGMARRIRAALSHTKEQL